MLRLFAISLFGFAAAHSQPYDLLLKNGHLIDPANNLDGPGDLAISNGRIARAGGVINGPATKTIDVTGRYVTPGLIDLHFHSYGYEGAIFPDDTALLTGATTVVDAGGAGYKTFDDFRKKIIAKAKTRVLVLLNIAGGGMVGSASEDNVADMLPNRTAEVIKANRDVIVGIKVAHFGPPGWSAIDAAIAAGRLASVPVMIDDKILTNAGRTSREKLLGKMRPGDMHTHMYNDRQVEIVSRFNGKVQEYALAARKRGVLFDLGHGAGSFLWPVAAAAARQGFWPDTISTDLHSTSIIGTKPDMPNCMSKLMSLGMTLQDAVKRSTLTPAKVIGRFPEIGTLSVDQTADVAVLALRDGVFAFTDSWGKKQLGTKKLEAVMTLRGGELLFDAEGRAFPEWTKAGNYEVIQ
ncbi:MAG: amidohydrolase family protein [Acidobacteria bacterium]|nr:amidohydrolase family protein [Acidobacteriota bacterium]